MGLLELFVLLSAVSGTAWIVGMVAWLWHRIKRLEDSALGQTEAPNALPSDLRELSDALAASDRELERLNERLDFLERLLSRGKEGETTNQRLASGTEPEGTDRGGRRE
jgi:uncharacterized coiled-coil protein SlyX